MIFSAPWFWLVALFAILPWIGPFRGLNKIQNLLRSLVFICLAAALARPQFVSDDAPGRQVVVIDQTASVDTDAANDAINRANKTARANKNAETHLVVLGDAPQNADGAFASVSSVPSGSQGESQLAAAIARAARTLPQGTRGSVSIVSDGLATRPDDVRAIAALRSRGVPVDVLPLQVASSKPAPVGLSWVDELQVGSTARLFAKVVAHGGGVSGTVELRAGEEVLASADYDGSAITEVPLSFEPKQGGFIEATLAVKTSGDERTMPVALAIREPVRLLYLGDLQKNGVEQLGKVLGAGFKVKSTDMSKPEQVAKDLASADLVVMDDLAAESVPEPVEQQVVGAVANEGLGLVMSGGRSGFGAGGWHDRPVEAMLPVELVQKEEKRDPSTSLVIVLDTSGSMSGVRVQLAKEVARLAMRRLMPHDKVGIVEFFGAKRWAAPLQPASNQIELQRALNRMDAGGGTVIMGALEEAFYGLQNVDTRYKHVLVLTDGGVEAGDFESLMRRMAGEGINVSTILCGGGYHSEFLVNVANWGKGRFYNVPNRFNLPEILLKQPSTAKLPAYRPGVHSIRARGGSGWWGDVNTSSIPGLNGYVETKPRTGSEVLLETVEGKHPVLATWRYGLGRVTTLATEPVGEGTRPWRDWEDYGKALARIMERSAADTRDPFRFEVEYDGGEVVIHAIRQRPRSVDGPNPLPIAKLDEKTGLDFVARSPNWFVANWPVPNAGETLRVLAGSDQTPNRMEPIAIASPIVPEDRVDPANGIDLKQLAAATGGRVLSLDGDWTAIEKKPAGKRLVSLSSWLFGLALVLFFAELVWRRLPAERS